jgi:hypothetical protein
MAEGKFLFNYRVPAYAGCIIKEVAVSHGNHFVTSIGSFVAICIL